MKNSYKKIKMLYQKILENNCFTANKVKNDEDAMINGV